MNNSALEKAYKLYSDQNFRDALPALQSLCGKSRGYAELYLGYMHQKGEGVEKDLEIALKYFLDSGNFGLALGARYGAALMEESGRLKDALKLYKKAALLGSISASYAVYRLFKKGVEGIDEAEASEFLHKANSAGHIYANREYLRRMLAGKYGFMGRIKSIPLFFVGIIRASFVVANDPASEKMR